MTTQAPDPARELAFPVTVYTTRARVPFLVDAADYEAVSHYVWSIDDRGYPTTMVGTRKERTTMRVHRFLLGRAPQGLEWDHIDRDKLNNQRSNLRPVTRRVNRRNVGLGPLNKSGVKGVCKRRSNPKWLVQINTGGRVKHIGYFRDLADAKAAREAAEVLYWGDNR